MLDKKTELMLQVANTLTAEDLDHLRGAAPRSEAKARPAASKVAEPSVSKPKTSLDTDEDLTRGEREKMRTRESKISTACVGQPRTKHEWWPVGTELIGRMRDQMFTAEVVKNPRVKSNRSLLITSGSAQGTVCITPTRAAMESTEAYRQAKGLGRGGGVTNGWTFWKPREATA